MKYIYSGEGKNEEHWLCCEKNKAPYIEISFIEENYTNIFFDVTNICSDLEILSEKIKSFYISYVDFFRICSILIDDVKSQYYFFNLVVKKEHAECIANQLYDFLLAFIKNEL